MLNNKLKYLAYLSMIATAFISFTFVDMLSGSFLFVVVVLYITLIELRHREELKDVKKQLDKINTLELKEMTVKELIIEIKKDDTLLSKDIREMYKTTTKYMLLMWLFLLVVALFMGSRFFPTLLSCVISQVWFVTMTTQNKNRTKLRKRVSNAHDVSYTRKMNEKLEALHANEME